MSNFSIKNIISSIKIERFVLYILAVVCIAYIFPEPGVYKGIVSFKLVGDIGASLVFFFYGLKLNKQQLISSVRNWKLHLIVQSATYLIFPLVAYVAYLTLAQDKSSLMWMGILFLASVPSTVSASVVMVNIAGGNVPAAIFNASISGLIGVFITPIWIDLFFSSANQIEISGLLQMMLMLIAKVIIPVTIGIFLNGRYGSWANNNKTTLKNFDQTVILMIVYSSFAHSFSEGSFATYSWSELIILATSMLVLFFAVFYTVKIFSKLLKLNREDEIVALFCGSKKSLVHGTVMSKIMFPTVSGLGLILLPLMLYHAIQILTCSIIANKMKQS